MSHETFLTTRDKARQAFGLMPKNMSLTWGLLTAGLGVAALAVGTGGLAIGLALGAAVTSFKTVESLALERKDSKALKTTGPVTDTPPPERLANNQEPIPQLADDISNAAWRKQLSDAQARRLTGSDWRGY